jgi:putative oxidoreductase
MSERLWHNLSTLLAWTLGALFIYAGVEKIVDPAQFAQSIKYFKMVKLEYINAIALILPWWEVAAGIAILTRSWRRVGAWIILLMLIAFTVAIASAVSRGLDISCGCFGKSSGKAGYSKLAENFGMIAAAGMVLWFRPRETPAEPALVEAAQPAA